MKIIISESQLRLITESEEDLEKIYEISKSDLDLAKMLLSNYDITLEELYGEKFNYLLDDVFNSNEVGYEKYLFKFKILFMEFDFEGQRPLISVQIYIIDLDNIGVDFDGDRHNFHYDDLPGGYKVYNEFVDIIHKVLSPHFDGIDINVLDFG